MLGQVFWVRRGIKPQREYSLADLCEDSVAQRGREVGFLRPIQVRSEWRCTESTQRGAGLRQERGPLWRLVGATGTTGRNHDLQPATYWETRRLERRSA